MIKIIAWGLFTILALTLSFLMTNLTVWAIMSLLGFTFKWKIGTAVWLILCLVIKG